MGCETHSLSDTQQISDLLMDPRVRSQLGPELIKCNQVSLFMALDLLISYVVYEEALWHNDSWDLSSNGVGIDEPLSKLPNICC